MKSVLMLWGVSVALASALLAAPAFGQRGTGADTLAVLSDTTSLRAQPTDTSRTLVQVPKGARVRVWMCSNGWCSTTHRTTTGFLRESSLATSQATAPAVPTGKGYYNSKGEWVPSPQASPSGPPTGASAQCRDGTYSFSRSRRGTCSHHGGVSRWL